MVETSVGLHGTAASRDGTAAELLHALAGALTALLAIAAMVVVWRRLAGVLDSPLGPSMLGLAGLVLIAMAWAARAACRRHVGCAGSRRDLPARILISMAVVALAAGMTLPGVNGLALAVFWAALVGSESWAWRQVLRPHWRTPREQVDPQRQTCEPEQVGPAVISGGASDGPPTVAWSESPSALPVASSVAEVATDDVPEPLEEEPEDLLAFEPATDVLQQLTLSRAKDGSQQLAGWLRMPVAVGQRTGNLHVAFCPPFAKTPEIEFEQLSGPPCRVKVAQRLPYGARLELKLAVAATEADSVLLRFSADAKG